MPCALDVSQGLQHLANKRTNYERFASTEEKKSQKHLNWEWRSKNTTKTTSSFIAEKNHGIFEKWQQHTTTGPKSKHCFSTHMHQINGCFFVCMCVCPLVFRLSAPCVSPWENSIRFASIRVRRYLFIWTTPMHEQRSIGRSRPNTIVALADLCWRSNRTEMYAIQCEPVDSAQNRNRYQRYR